MDKLRVGIAGLGGFGELHLLAFSQLPYVQVTRLCSRSEERARALAARFGVPHISTDREEFARADDVDLVSVVTAGMDHRAVAVPALEAGKHVLIEKPMAATLEDARAIVAAAERASGQCMIAHICRFQPPYYRAWQLVREGRLGELALIQTWRHNHYTVFDPVHRQNPLRETGIHDIDLALWLADSHVVSASGYRSYHQSDQEADTACAVARLANGTLCTFSASWLKRDALPTDVDARMKLIGTRGEIEINTPPQDFRFVDDNEHRFLNPEVVQDPIIMGQTGLMAEIGYFCRCVLEGRRADMVTPRDALRSLEAAVLIDAACEEVR